MSANMNPQPNHDQSNPAYYQRQQPPPYYPQPQPPYYYAAPAAPRTKFVGLAWTALALGIVGVAGSPLPILNNASAIAAAIGIVIGIIALFGTRKVLAAFGTVLSAAGLAITLALQAAWAAELDKINLPS